MHKRRLVSVISLTITATLALEQLAFADRCGDALAKGRTLLEYSSDTSFREALKTALSWNRDQLRKRAQGSETSAEISIPLAKKLLEVGGEHSGYKKEYDRLVEQYRSNKDLAVE